MQVGWQQQQEESRQQGGITGNADSSLRLSRCLGREAGWAMDGQWVMGNGQRAGLAGTGWVGWCWCWCCLVRRFEAARLGKIRRREKLGNEQMSRAGPQVVLVH